MSTRKTSDGNGSGYRTNFANISPTSLINHTSPLDPLIKEAQIQGATSFYHRLRPTMKGPLLRVGFRVGDHLPSV